MSREAIEALRGARQAEPEEDAPDEGSISLVENDHGKEAFVHTHEHEHTEDSGPGDYVPESKRKKYKHTHEHRHDHDSHYGHERDFDHPGHEAKQPHGAADPDTEDDGEKPMPEEPKGKRREE